MARDPVQPQEHSGNRAAAANSVRSAQNGRLSPAMNIDKFKPAIVYTIYLASPPEKVWQALTSAEFSRKYFFGNAVEVDQKVGGAYVVRTPDGALHISGEVMECDQPHRLKLPF